MNNACKYVTTIFDESMHALNVSFYIMRVILFCYLIVVSSRLYMSPDQTLQRINILVYLDVIGKNTICTTEQTLRTFAKPGKYG